MSAAFQPRFSGIGLIRRWLLVVGLLAGMIAPAWAKESATAELVSAMATRGERAEPAWLELDPVAEQPTVRIWLTGPRGDQASECFVITHGMGGTTSGDSFHRLAAILHHQFPRASVLRIDWSERASVKFAGLPVPWKVAASIDAVGDEATLVLKQMGIDSQRTTFLGESFGNWVNARIAYQLGGVHAILAINPASESGGYAPPDLRKLASHSWALHTWSVFDTTLEIADGDFWLETPADASPFAQHVAGIRWLTARIEAGDDSWLRMDKPLPARRAGHFRASATLRGELSEKQMPRERPPVTDRKDGPTKSPPVDVAITAP